jgi:hypothetical protein
MEQVGNLSVPMGRQVGNWATGCKLSHENAMTPLEAMQRIDVLLSHVWMVRTFLKHSDEAEGDEELCEIYRTLYDYILALGEPAKNNDSALYLKTAGKKYPKLRGAMQRFCEIQPEISSHTNFQMASASLKAAVDEIGSVLQSATQQVP